jgi:hypothetical protein
MNLLRVFQWVLGSGCDDDYLLSAISMERTKGTTGVLSVQLMDQYE